MRRVRIAVWRRWAGLVFIVMGRRQPGNVVCGCLQCRGAAHSVMASSSDMPPSLLLAHRPWDLRWDGVNLSLHTLLLVNHNLTRILI